MIFCKGFTIPYRRLMAAGRHPVLSAPPDKSLAKKFPRLSARGILIQTQAVLRSYGATESFGNGPTAGFPSALNNVNNNENCVIAFNACGRFGGM